MNHQPKDEASRPALPDGLYDCRFCGDVAGHLEGHKSTCLCEGISCRTCGIGRVRRPTSDHYEPSAGTFIHSPYFIGMGGCRHCVITVYGSVPDDWYSWPGPLAHDPSLKELLALVNEAGLALSSSNARPATDQLELKPPASALRALHGGEAVWRELGLEKPPDDRPLWVGAGHRPLPGNLPGHGVELAIWRSNSGDLERVEKELIARWEPPLP